MGTYFKATRPDGMDFATGTVDYASALVSGKRVRPVERVAPADRALCRPGVLHAATVPTETLVGGSWPCRLFRVEGRPLSSLNMASHSHKRGFASLQVVEELPAWQALGPQGVQVAALIDRARRLTADEARRLAAARSAARAAAGAAARALIVADLIPTDAYDLLVGPWRQVIGDPMAAH